MDFGVPKALQLIGKDCCVRVNNPRTPLLLHHSSSDALATAWCNGHISRAWPTDQVTPNRQPQAPAHGLDYHATEAIILSEHHTLCRDSVGTSLLADMLVLGVQNIKIKQNLTSSHKVVRRIVFYVSASLWDQKPTHHWVGFPSVRTQLKQYTIAIAPEENHKSHKLHGIMSSSTNCVVLASKFMRHILSPYNTKNIPVSKARGSRRHGGRLWRRRGI